MIKCTEWNNCNKLCLGNDGDCTVSMVEINSRFFLVYSSRGTNYISDAHITSNELLTFAQKTIERKARSK